MYRSCWPTASRADAERRFDASGAPQFDEAIWALDNDAPFWVLDFAGVGYLSSIGLRSWSRWRNPPSPRWRAYPRGSDAGRAPAAGNQPSRRLAAVAAHGPTRSPSPALRRSVRLSSGWHRDAWCACGEWPVAPAVSSGGTPLATVLGQRQPRASRFRVRHRRLRRERGRCGSGSARS